MIRINYSSSSPYFSSSYKSPFNFVLMNRSRYFSNESKDAIVINDRNFKPRRRSPSSYREIKSRYKKPKGPMNEMLPDNFGDKIYPIGGDYYRNDEQDENDKKKEEQDKMSLVEDDEDEIELDERLWLPQDKSRMYKLEDEFKDDPLSLAYGPELADTIRHLRREKERNHPYNVESQLRLFDWMSGEMGSSEDLVMNRRALMESTWNEDERQQLEKDFEEMISKYRDDQFELTNDEGEANDTFPLDLDNMNINKENKEYPLVEGPWKIMVVKVGRVQKVERGGTKVSYRSLVIGGNCKGVAGFATGKGNTPQLATTAARRKCKRNIYFIQRPYQGSGLVHDLVGKHNSCKVILRSVSQGYGLRGNPLVQDILLAFGITDCSAKAYGRRNPYSVIYATFKALSNYEAIDDIALRRGQKFLNFDRARRLAYS